jgi:hypothetical protein
MKRVNIASLPRDSDNILAQVPQEPPYNFIQYAAAANIQFYLSQYPAVLRVSELSGTRCHKDITIYLTTGIHYFFVVESQIGYRSFTKMCTRTRTTTIANNKSMVVTLITTLGNLRPQTAMLLSKSYRYSTNNKLELK